METVILKYNAGNIQSVLFALDRMGVEATVTDDHEAIQSASRVIFPGVGEASSAMRYLRERKLDVLIRGLRQPVLGICLGMQLLCEHSEENNTTCLGIVPLQVRRFETPPGEERIKVPQVGWNSIHELKTGLFIGIEEKSFVYNVHSYYVEDTGFTIASSNYGLRYASAICKDNFYGVQFHAEKSGEVGERILRNFLSLK